MGRQLYLVRLAFGRGAFAEPELDENGNFVIGPRAYELDNADHYEQQWDRRGHPQNKRSKVLAREFRHAKNETLETVGLAVRKNALSRSAWQKKSESQRRKVVIEENELGAGVLGWAYTVYWASTWWIKSLRNRVQVFYSSSTLPLSEMMRSEVPIVGPVAFFTSGMLAWLAGTWPGHWILGPIHSPKRRKHASLLGRITQAGIDEAVLLSEWPIRMLSVLQRLHLISPSHIPTASSLVPFDEGSPIFGADAPASSIALSAGWAATSFFCKPIILAMLHELIRFQIETTIYFTLRYYTPAPNRMDRLSSSALAVQDLEPIDLPCLLTDYQSYRHGCWYNIRRPLRMYVPFVYTAFVLAGKFFTGRDISKLPLPDDLEPRLKITVAQLFRELVRSTRRQIGDIDTETRQRLQFEAINRPFSEVGLVPPADYVDLDNWIADLPALEDVDDASTSTPEQEELFDMEDVQNNDGSETNATTHLGNETGPAHAARRRLLDEILLHGGARPSSVSNTGQSISLQSDSEQRRDVDTNHGYSVVGTIWEGETPTANDNDNFPTAALSTSQAPELESSQPHNLSQPTRSRSSSVRAPEETPSPGIARAQSLATISQMDMEAVIAAYNHSATDTRIRLNEEDQAINHVVASPSLFPESPSHPHDHSQPNFFHRLPSSTHPTYHLPPQLIPLPSNAIVSPSNGPRDDKSYRVTILTNTSADLFASITSSILATFLLLPLESTFLRSLTRDFLSHPASRPGALEAAQVIARDVRGLDEWFGGSRHRTRYVTNLGLCLGLQGLVGLGVWGGFSAWAVSLGRRRGGWGEF